MIDGKTKLIAHLGYPTESFKAPMIYNPYFDKHKINAVVVPMGCKAENYAEFLKLARCFERRRAGASHRKGDRARGRVRQHRLHAQRQGSNGARVLRHILAFAPVASRSCRKPRNGATPGAPASAHP